MSTHDKINQLPDGYRLFLSDTNGAFTRDSEIDTDELKRLVSDLEAKDEWRLALESFTPNGSEYVNDLPRCISFVREKFADRHEAKKEVVRLRRELETAKRALEWIANRPDAEMAAAKTLHYDMRGIAQAALKSE